MSFFRRTPPPPEDPVETHNRLFQEGSLLIAPYAKLHDAPSRSPEGEDAARDIREGFSRLRQVLAMNPGNWAAHWMMGKGHQALGDHAQAFVSFQASWDLHKGNPDVARELMLECLHLGKGPEGVAVAEQALKLAPEDAGLVANHALALLVDGRLGEAERRIADAIALAPGDDVSVNLRRVIAEVRAGTRPQPRTFGDLHGLR